MKSKADNPARKEGIRPSEVLHPDPIERARVSGEEAEAVSLTHLLTLSLSPGRVRRQGGVSSEPHALFGKRDLPPVRGSGQGSGVMFRVWSSRVRGSC